MTTSERRGPTKLLKCRKTCELLASIVEIVPLQLLAYDIAVHRDCDVDQRWDMAKSVTVE